MPRTILIADDNALVRAALRQVLEDEKFGEIVEAEDGEEAILLAQRVKPDLIILDLAMPFLDGLTTARELSKLMPQTPILMHTLYHSPRVELEAMKVGVRKTVAKSNSTVLIAALRELLPPIDAPPELSQPRSQAASTADKENTADSENTGGETGSGKIEGNLPQAR